MRDDILAKVASAFFESPGLQAIIELQRRMDEICNPSWMRQLDKIESIQRQLDDRMHAIVSLHPAILSSATAVAKTWSTILPDSLVEALQHAEALEAIYAPLAPALAQYSELQSALSARLSEWSTITEAIQSSSLALQREYAIDHVCTLAENIFDVIGADEDEPAVPPSELSTEDEQIIANEVSLILASGKNWEQRLMDSVAKLKKTHPVLATVLWQIIWPLLVGILGSLIATVIGQANAPAKVYEKPRTTSPVVYHLEPLQEVKIIGEEPYYFQIELTDSNTQETMVGFVSKRSIKEVDTQEEPSAQ